MLKIVSTILLITALLYLSSCGGSTGSGDSFNYDSSSPSEPQETPAPTDQFSAGLVQSVGTDGDALISGSNLTIEGNIANFSGLDISTFNTNIGVGDVVVYGSDYAIIKGISIDTNGAKAYVSKKDGSLAPATTSGSTFTIYRAFTSLANWESQTQNPNITPNITLTNLDLSDSDDENGPMHVACYADGADTTGVLISGWTTTESNYIKIYTPTTTSQVITSQRHQGTWSDQKYRLVMSGSHAINIKVPYIRIEGLQIHITTPTGHKGLYFVSMSLTDSDIRISHNIIKGANDPTNSIGWHSGIQVYNIGTGGEFRIWNNIFYDFISTGNYPCGIDFDDPQFFAYVYNNTFYNNTIGLMNYTDERNMLAINNLSYNNATNYWGWSQKYSLDSRNNLSGPIQTTAPGNDPINAATISFVDAANDNFQLSASDLNAINAGFDLSEDTDLPFNTDIAGNSRSGTWDVGASEY